ncbi:MAG: hypothetical protein OXU20_34425 [Myxococcales bacterium]|nr:hypothetical protein [Myxococcales bacterium]MDD9970505.1 hypothetical protein [Myxococcales bacterium]
MAIGADLELNRRANNYYAGDRRHSLEWQIEQRCIQLDPGDRSLHATSGRAQRDIVECDLAKPDRGLAGSKRQTSLGSDDPRSL